jgi:carbamoyltransferase
MKPIYVLGTGLSHDGSACLLKDGVVELVIEKERITRVKHDGRNDRVTIQTLLDTAGITWDDISLVVQSNTYGMFQYGNGWYFGERNIPEGIPTVSMPHHLAHAYSAFFFSPFKESAILVIDGCGSVLLDCIAFGDITDTGFVEPIDPSTRHLFYETVSYYQGHGKDISAVKKNFSVYGYPPISVHPIVNHLVHSIGGYYEGATDYMFPQGSDQGELMGLAAYGDPNVYPHRIFEFVNGEPRANYDWLRLLEHGPTSWDDFMGRFRYFANVARFIQDEVAEIVVTLANDLHAHAPSKNLCYAGGVALNVVANSRIQAETQFENVFVTPPANDAGIGIGCAFYGWHAVLGNDKVPARSSVYVGPSPNKNDVREFINCLFHCPLDVSKPDNLNEEAAKLIASGKVVGCYRGRAEIGPRALGNRSILGDPTKRELRDHINNSIKTRPDFRPFAPAVLMEDAPMFFDIEKESPYMLFVHKVKDEWKDKLPAVTHVDGTARVQTVSASDNPEFYDLLKEVKKVTGIGMVLNTSFNRKREPMVERVSEAFDMFWNTPMDALILDEYLLVKRYPQ